MNRTEMLNKIKKALPEKRFQHSLGVEETSLELAEIYHISKKQASTAALLHDYAKYYDYDKAREIIETQKMDPKLLEFHPSLWHAPVGAYLAKTEFGVTDPAILEAIRVHTTGSDKMSELDKIIYLADYTEPGRDFPGVSEARLLTHQSLDDAMLYALSRTITYLVDKQSAIFPDTFAAYNHFISSKK